MCYLSNWKKTFIHEIEYDLESELDIYLQFFTDWYYKHEDYCVKCKKDTDNIDSKIFRIKNNRLLIQSKVFVKMKNQDL